MSHNFRKISFSKYSHSISCLYIKLVGISSLTGLASQAALSAPKIPQCRLISLNMARVDFIRGVQAWVEYLFSMHYEVRFRVRGIISRHVSLVAKILRALKSLNLAAASRTVKTWTFVYMGSSQYKCKLTDGSDGATWLYVIHLSLSGLIFQILNFPHLNKIVLNFQFRRL